MSKAGKVYRVASLAGMRFVDEEHTEHHTLTRYALTKGDRDFEAGSTVFIDENFRAYVVHDVNHPGGYTANVVEYDGELYCAFPFPWRFLSEDCGYQVEEDED